MGAMTIEEHRKEEQWSSSWIGKTEMQAYSWLHMESALTSTTSGMQSTSFRKAMGPCFMFAPPQPPSASASFPEGIAGWSSTWINGALWPLQAWSPLITWKVWVADLESSSWKLMRKPSRHVHRPRGQDAGIDAALAQAQALGAGLGPPPDPKEEEGRGRRRSSSERRKEKRKKSSLDDYLARNLKKSQEAERSRSRRKKNKRRRSGKEAKKKKSRDDSSSSSQKSRSSASSHFRSAPARGGACGGSLKRSPGNWQRKASTKWSGS